MNLDARLRRLEAEPASDPEMAAITEWPSSVDIEHLRALRDHLHSAVNDDGYDVSAVWTDQRLRVVLEAAPPSLQRLFAREPA